MKTGWRERLELRPPRTWLYLLLVMAVGTVVRLWDIAKASIWHDEGYSLMLAPMSPGKIIARTARDVHPPLYYLVLHYWMLAFGRSEVAVRGLSTAFLVAAIPVAYLLVRKLWSESAGRLAALFVATGPFLIRYSQETRMYGMVAFLTLLGTYCLVRALEADSPRWWAAYTASMAAAMYTHYYTVFMFVVHGLYLLVQTRRGRGKGLRNGWWWGSVGASVVLFLPWVPTAYHQFTRVQAGFWIPPVQLSTIPTTIYQFLCYASVNSPSHLINAALIALAALLCAVVAYVGWRFKQRRMPLWLLGCYSLVGPLLVFLASFRRPIYIDRYFVFAAVGFYCLLAVMVMVLPKSWMRWLATIVILGLFALGVHNVHVGATHQMRFIGEYVDNHFQSGDEIISGELYTFFDFSYYNDTAAQTHLWSTNGVNGYGESSLFYDRANQVVIKQLSSVHPASHFVWMVGKTGYQQYYDPKILPSNWTAIDQRITAGDSAVQLYYVK